MITKVLEAKVILKDKEIGLINTLMDIELDWDAEIKKSDNIAEVIIKANKISGWFSWETKYDNYTIENKVKFSFKPENIIVSEVSLHPISPESVVINLDTKNVKIWF